MRSSSRLSLACISFAFVTAACGDDTSHDDLFAEPSAPSFAAGTGVAAGAAGNAEAKAPSGGATATTDTTASGSSEVGAAGASSDAPGSDDAPSGSASPPGGASGGSASGGSSGSGAPSGANLSAELHLCGKLESFTAAGAQAGAVAIGGKALPIAAGTTVSGQLLATVGAGVCLDAKLDDDGNVRASASLSLDVAASLRTTARAKACGKVTAYVAASASANGDVALGGAHFGIAANASVTAEAKLVVGASVCVDASLDRNGAIVSAVVSAN